MNTLLLEPGDVLFFRDGRPMSGSLSGHGAAWPLPTVTNAALHAALHRADLEKIFGQPVHGHDHHRTDGGSVSDARKFGSLVTVGPFPVSPEERWFFPRPLDTGADPENSTKPAYSPLGDFDKSQSSLPDPLRFPVLHDGEPSKEIPAPWWSREAWEAYLAGGKTNPGKDHFRRDEDYSGAEHQIGIGIDPATGTQDGEQFYSAHYLRLREHWRLGVLAEASDKIDKDPANRRDLIAALFRNSGAETPVIVGGQQRVCTVRRDATGDIPLPASPGIEGNRVKWVLLTPAIFPEIPNKDRNGNALIDREGNPLIFHRGGWLPNWVTEKPRQLEGERVDAGGILLLDGPGKEKARRKKLTAGKRIKARLVAAMTGKPVAVTGYALPHEAADRHGGPKPTHFAVPAGSVYYFEADNPEAAQQLAAALNWHGGASHGKTEIRNRRSTLMGEKGFGLGVCASWDFASPRPPRTSANSPSS